jgi:hypothetical protein
MVVIQGERSTSPNCIEIDLTRTYPSASARATARMPFRGELQ